MSKKKQSPRRGSAQSKESYELREAQRLARKHKAYRKKWLIALGCVLAAAAVTVGGFFLWNVIRNRPRSLQKMTAAKTDHYSVNAAMLAYYFQGHIDSYLSFAASGTSIPTFDTAQSLRTQYYDADAGTTWYSYLMDYTMNTVQQTLKLCEAAYDAGFQLTDEEMTKIRSDAEAVDLSKYQEGVTTEDVEAVMTLQTIAADYQREALGGITVSDEEIRAEVSENEHDYLTFNMLCYTFAWTQAEAEAGATAHINAAKQHAQELSECTTREAFEAYVTRYETEERGATAEEAAQTVRAMRMMIGYSGYSDDVKGWIETAKPGETYILDSSDQYYVEVMMLLDEPALDPSECVDLRVIYLPSGNYNYDIDATVDAAEALIEQCKNAGSSESAFAQLAVQHSADTSTASNGGLVEGYSRMRTTYGAETADWAFESGRQPGDMFICKRSAAVAIAYYVGKNNRCGWENQVYQALYSSKNKEISAALVASDVTVNSEVQQYIDG